MGLFSRRGTANEPAPVEWASVEAEQQKRPHGPFDRSQVGEMGPRVDLGAIWLPVMPGLELRMEIDKKTQKVTGVTAALEGSNLQIQAFAAPRTEGIWDEIRHEIAQSVSGQGGIVDDVPGVFGRELLVRMPVKGPEGRPGSVPARFIGVDGPRWFIRGVLAGKAALDARVGQAAGVRVREHRRGARPEPAPARATCCPWRCRSRRARMVPAGSSRCRARGRRTADSGPRPAAPRSRDHPDRLTR